MGRTSADVLRRLGVGKETLTAGERKCLDEDGFLNLGKLLTDAQIKALRHRISELLTGVEDGTGTEALHPEPGTRRLFDCCNKGPEFDITWTHPRLLAAVAHILDEDLRISALNYREPLEGHGHQVLHVDWPWAVKPGKYFVCNSFWCLDDMTQENGAPCMIRGSHRSGRVPWNEEVSTLIEYSARTDLPKTERQRALRRIQEATARSPMVYVPPGEEVIVEARAGEVVVMNSHIWHGGTLNESGRPRGTVQSYWTRRDALRQWDQKAHILLETRRRLTADMRWLLDV